MVCTTAAAGVVVCGPDNSRLRKRYLRCPMCECTTEMVTRDDGWYGRTIMCCRCGDSWNSGELRERPFARGWRKRAITKHRRLWDMATHGPDPTFEELFPEYADTQQTARPTVTVDVTAELCTATQLPEGETT